MKNLLLLPMMLLAACATTGGGSHGSTAPFQGPDAVQKRRNEISDAAAKVMDCMKVKPGEAAGSGGVFAVVAAAGGKLTVTPIVWNGPEPMKQCVVDTGSKVQITPLPGPSVGMVWPFDPPGSKLDPPKAPDDLSVKMQPLRETMQTDVISCGQRFLGVDFGATIDVAYFLYNNGQAYAPTVISSDAKDGSFDSCVQEVVTKTKFPTLSVDRPFPTTMHFKIGQYGDTQHKE